jgi:hypothetical protein
MKTLITGGCSFSECKNLWIKTWPIHLTAALLDYQHTSTAMGSQGNGLISRRVIYQVTETLKHTAAEDILVGIMWSGPDRHDFYVEQVPEMLKEDGWMENPTKFIKDSTGAWAIMNDGWKMHHAKLYYTEFYTRTGALIYTFEHILRTQWFLKQHGIKYFMTTYTGDVMPDYVKTFADTAHLYNEIDFTNFLPVIGEYEWCRDHSGLEFPEPNDYHPSDPQHKLFVEQVIVPFIKERNLV